MGPSTAHFRWWFQVCDAPLELNANKGPLICTACNPTLDTEGFKWENKDCVWTILEEVRICQRKGINAKKSP